jgi:seryl-tRNA synthetase
MNMLEIKFIRQNLTDVKQAMVNRGDHIDLEALIVADDNRKKILLEIEALRHKRNVVSDQIATMKKDGQTAEATMAEMREVSSQIKALDRTLSENEAVMQTILLQIPNIPHGSVPIGQDENDNPVLRTVGQPCGYEFRASSPLGYW